MCSSLRPAELCPCVRRWPPQGINRLNGVCVPLYDTFGEPAVDYVIRHAGVRLVVTQVRRASVQHTRCPVAPQLTSGARCKPADASLRALRRAVAPPQAVKLPLIASLLSKGTKEVVTQGVVYWGKAAPEPLKVRCRCWLRGGVSTLPGPQTARAQCSASCAWCGKGRAASMQQPGL